MDKPSSDPIEEQTEPMTWGIPAGQRVYGFHKGQLPPDLQRPWEFDPRGGQSPLPASPSQQPTAEQQQQPPPPPPPPQHPTGAEAAPPPFQEAPEGHETSLPLPDPFGPAITPGQRLALIYTHMPPEDGGRDERR